MQIWSCRIWHGNCVHQRVVRLASSPGSGRKFLDLDDAMWLEMNAGQVAGGREPRGIDFGKYVGAILLALCCATVVSAGDYPVPAPEASVSAAEPAVPVPEPSISGAEPA